jgi:signal transduction histidine kinase
LDHTQLSVASTTAKTDCSDGLGAFLPVLGDGQKANSAVYAVQVLLCPWWCRLQSAPIHLSRQLSGKEHILSRHRSKDALGLNVVGIWARSFLGAAATRKREEESQEHSCTILLYLMDKLLDRALAALARRVWPDRSEVRLRNELTHLRSRAQLALIFLFTVLGPGVALAWIGMSAIGAESSAVWEEVRQEGDRELRDVLKEVEELFTGFEAQVKTRLVSGRSPVHSQSSISPFLLTSLRLDSSGSLAAPFTEEPLPPLQDQSFYFSPIWRQAQALEKNAPTASSAAYLQASRKAESIHEEGEALFNAARMKAKAGDTEKAIGMYADLFADYSEVRTLHGFRLGDLASLKRGELRMQDDPEIGAADLRELVERLLNRRWSLGSGALDAAVAARALELVEDVAEKDWLARSRGRLDSQVEQLYWAKQLYPELRVFHPEGRVLPVARGEFSYRLGTNALWATMWWGEDKPDFYAFALDISALEKEIQALTRSATRTSETVNMVVITADRDAPEDTLTRRSLSPWLRGYELAVHPRSATDLKNSQRRKSFQRAAILVLALVIIVMGAGLTLRLVGQELTIARSQSDFAANVSHELRSPITQIRLKGESLQLGMAETEQELNDHYDAIVRESERLSRLVDNVLDFAAIDGGHKTYTFRPVPIAQTIESTVQSARYSMEMRDMHLDLNLSPHLPVVVHDPDAIAQVLLNLISNAAKYGKEGAWIGINAEMIDEEVVISVSDRGIGIAPEELPHLFEHFYRSSDPAARRRKGTGIGLSIVQYIVEAHGGRVEVSSTLNVGSIFALHFPLTPPTSA